MSHTVSHAEDGIPTPLLVAHRSTLPNFLYILSFAPPVPSLLRQPRAFAVHPYTLYVTGVITATIAGLGLPAFDIVFGFWTNGIREGAPSEIRGRGDSSGLIMTIVGVVFFICTTVFLTCFITAAIKLSDAARQKYLEAIMVQDPAFFDRVGSGDIATRARKDIDSMRIGMGERLGYLCWSLSTILAAFVSGFAHTPRQAGFLFTLIPTTILLLFGLGVVTDKISARQSALDGRISSHIEQVLSSIRIVHAFDMAPALLTRMETALLRPWRKLTKRLSLVKAIEQGAVFGAGLIVYSMSFWFGGREVASGTSVGNVLTTFYNFVNIFFAAAGMVPHFIATTNAIRDLGNIRLQIEREPLIDIRSPDGLRFDADWQPSFELDGVTFAYPSRPMHAALNNVSFRIEAGKFTAMAGPSGSGKSTIGSLLQRMYDPESLTHDVERDAAILKSLDEGKMPISGPHITSSGTIRMSGRNIKDFNVTWLRSQVAVVLQNPQLSSGTIYENVAAGLITRSENDSALIESALRKAQAWDFVSELPKGLHTEITGERTGLLSGGQVQRIAIARALVRRPKCLLLDEATSAVSADTEAKIQESLIAEQKETGMTMIVIAHRLSTLINADTIIVMRDGSVVQSGTYDELVSPSCPDPTFRLMVEAKPTVTKHLPSTSTVVSEKGESIHETLEYPYILPPAPSSPWHVFRSIAPILIPSAFLGIVLGGAFTAIGYLQGQGVAALNNPDLHEMRREVNRWALWFLVVALVSGLSSFLFTFGIEWAGQKLVADLKRESVRALSRQEVAFFEKTKTGSGSLTAAVASNTSNVGNFVGVVLASVIMSLSNFVGTVALAFALSWRLAAMVIAPLVLASGIGYLNFRFLERFEETTNEQSDEQAAFVAESVNSIGTIASLSREAETMRQFEAKFAKKSIDMKNLIGASATMGFIQAVVDLFGALIFWWGATLVSEKRVDLASLFAVVEAVLVTLYVCPKMLTYGGDFQRMRKAMRTIKEWMDRAPIQATAPDVDDGEKSSGLVLHDIALQYPSRPDVTVLQGIHAHFEDERSYAFCGTSGAGKSSILAILERFYEPSSGKITLDGRDVRSMSLAELRGEIGYVSQEPILFEGSVRFNLELGLKPGSRASEGDLEWSLKQANILPFVHNLPEGIDTDLGMKGRRLSGGQRQASDRLCIARALLRKPRILLLDEATSALDGESEAAVQTALDMASAGRMTITIGHRLSSIIGANVIYVMDQGKIVETGTHDELVGRKGKYFELVQAQL
ncbi:P-loop containing nucleoside triphosphate hydrolase protein [Kockovaella imperatae]|uniref:p-loop containing nucleoside triphosphate hydrolase protein n=1 Tax=Kockovaella imperatae TaxID=4999 RepID=A0A1Y1UNV6_9TREE|nr:P-loop containing nucleoside triphosphate hydrolase protein [Kockovaella imperatae]ORX39728.1 P-loop containing nucleoside triphosphate hydrolase protein [Kockovaella imperatae]